MRALFCLALVVFGCADPEPPRFYSIDDEFSDEQEALIDDAFAAWGDAVSYRPTKVLWSDKGRVYADHGLPNRTEGSVAFCDVGRWSWRELGEPLQEIHVDVNHIISQPGYLDWFWLAVAHEIGHYRIDGHLGAGLMVRKWEQEQMPGLCIDVSAATAWCDGADCESMRPGCYLASE